MSIAPSAAQRARYRRPTAVIGAALLAVALAFPGGVLLGVRRYHHPFSPTGTHVLEAARNLAPITIWGTALLIAGLLVPFMFSRDAWPAGVAGCFVGFTATAFLGWSYIMEIGHTGEGWLSLSETAPTCAGSLVGMILATWEHVSARAAGRARR